MPIEDNKEKQDFIELKLLLPINRIIESNQNMHGVMHEKAQSGARFVVGHCSFEILQDGRVAGVIAFVEGELKKLTNEELVSLSDSAKKTFLSFVYAKYKAVEAMITKSNKEN